MMRRLLPCLLFVPFMCASSALLAHEQAPGAIPVGMVWWPADPAGAVNALMGELEACLAEHLQAAAPEVVLARQRAVRDALFPLLELETQPTDEAAFAALIGREDVRARLLRRGLRYLIVYAGGTHREEGQGGVLCGGGGMGGGCFGLGWQDERTRLDAALWALESGKNIHQEVAQVEGTSVMPAFIIPVPIPARTKASACRELGTRLGIAIRQIEAARQDKP